MGEPAKIAQELDPHLCDLAVVDAVFAAAPRPKVDRKKFPSRFLLPKDEGERDILELEIRGDLAQRFSHRARTH
jgi:hypothetical protein